MVNIKTPAQLIIQYKDELLRKIFTTEAIISPIRPIIRYPPKFKRFDLVVKPTIDITKNIADVTSRVVKMEALV